MIIFDWHNKYCKKINIQIIVIGSTCTMLVQNLSFSLSHACIYREIYFKIKLYLFIVNNVIKYFRYSYYHFLFGSYVRYLKSIIFRVFQLSVVYFRLFANVQNKDSSDERVSEKNCHCLLLILFKIKFNIKIWNPYLLLFNILN